MKEEGGGRGKLGEGERGAEKIGGEREKEEKRAPTLGRFLTAISKTSHWFQRGYVVEVTSEVNFSPTSNSPPW